MTSYPVLKRWLAAALTLCVVGAALVFVYMQDRNVQDRNVSASGDAARAQESPPKKQDWTMYGGTPSRNMVNMTAKGLTTKWNAQQGGNIKWVADLGSKAYGGPIIAGGRVFVGTNNQNPRDKKLMKVNPQTGEKEPIDLGVMMCFDEVTGKFNWQTVFEKLPGGLPVDWPREGICSGASVEGDRLYYVSNRCEVVCADVKSGKPEWKLDMIGKLGVYPHNLSDCSPLLLGNHLWVVTSNGVNEDHINVPAPKAPTFIKVDKKKGEVLWQDNAPTAALLVAQKGNLAQGAFFKALVNRGELVQHGQWSNPSAGVVDGQMQIVFPGGDGWIRAFDTDGKLIWKFDCNPKDSKYELSGRGTRSDFIATPVIYKNRVYIGVGQDPEHETGVGHLWCIDMTKKGDVSPELVVNSAVYPPETKPNPNSAKVWHYGGLINNPKLVQQLKRQYYFGRTMSTCAILDDIVYVADLNGVLHCLDANTGNVHWEHDTKSAIWSSPYYADGKVYLGTDEADVFVFKHSKKKELLAKNTMDSAVRATPVAANGVLYVMTENQIFAIVDKK